jgi:hypothetical protein
MEIVSKICCQPNYFEILVLGKMESSLTGNILFKNSTFKPEMNRLQFISWLSAL